MVLESHILFIIWFVLYRKYVSITARQLYSYFGTTMTLLTHDSVVSWSLMTRTDDVISRMLVNKPLEYNSLCFVVKTRLRVRL